MVHKSKFVIKKSEVFLAFIGSILVRWCVSLGNYSGQSKPPMYGDYEAQRHWQEVTFNLPVTKWYTNSSRNDLLYWGLDYPPLTAYHSWLCGYVASKIDPKWVELDTSKGFESYEHKLFMRYTVLIVDLLVFFPAVYLFWHQIISFGRAEKHSETFLALLLFLFYPGLALIDHGHFQYNNFSLGLFLWSVLGFSKQMDIFGSICFCLALNYKQMELFHALPIFFYLLGKAFSQNPLNFFKSILKLAITVLVCFALLWAPYITSLDSTVQVLNRLFPVGRGLYEDKVANLWCTVSPVIKLKQKLTQEHLVKLCAASTLLLSFPACIHLFKNPTIRNLKFSLVNVSLIFFLFSYQVHEKSILIPAVSSCLLFGKVSSLVITWFLYFTVISMGSLLMKDQLIMQMLSTSVLFLILYLSFDKNEKQENKTSKLIRSTFWISVLFGAFLTILPFYVDPPERYPDLWAVLNSSTSCAAFLLFSVIFHYHQFTNKLEPVGKKLKKS